VVLNKATTATILKLAVHLGALLPLVWLALAVFTNNLGGEPVEAIIHFLGKGALHLLLLSLCVSPLARGLKAGALMRLRRPLGLWAFAYANLHFSVWLSLDLQFAWQTIGEEIVKRQYLLVGFVTWLILTALAVTSIPRILRRMGKNWKKLHNWIYLAALLAPIHYLWSVKSGLLEPLLYLAAAVGLVALRYKTLTKPWRKRGSRSQPSA
jgi:sulfoxide reductase heme-binding subunit YedZ